MSISRRTDLRRASPARRGRKRARGQALAEFALALPFLLVMGFGAFSMGNAQKTQLAVLDASRAGARWASDNQASWSSATTPAFNSIQGQILAEAGNLTLANNDATINISYYDAATAGNPRCGYYDVAPTPGMIYDSGYSLATCVKSGNYVVVTVTTQYSYVPIIANLVPLNKTLSSATGAFIS